MTSYNVKDYFYSRYVDGVLLEMDMSQLEVCALAEITKDPVLIDELNNGLDIHRRNAAIWKGCPESEVDDKTRKRAKVMTFQTIYGAGTKKIAETLGLSDAEVRNFLMNFTNKYLNVAEYFSAANRFAKRTRTPHEPVTKVHTVPTETPTTRVYTVESKLSPHYGEWGVSPTFLKNYPIQGFATGDLVPLVANIILGHLGTYDEDITKHIKFINTVHDSIMFDLTKEKLPIILSIIELAFCNLVDQFEELFGYKLTVEYSYDVKIGPTWGDMTDYTRSQVIDMITNDFLGV